MITYKTYLDGGTDEIVSKIVKHLHLIDSCISQQLEL